MPRARVQAGTSVRACTSDSAVRASFCLAILLAGCGDPAIAQQEHRERAATTPQPTAELEPEPEPESERLVDLGSFSDARHGPRRVRAYLPRAYASQPEARFPVVYVLDGQSGLAELEVGASLDALIDEGVIEPWIAVLIDSTNARSEELAGDPERFTELVLDTIAPAVEEQLRVRTAREDTAILGYSYGGLAAVRAQLHRPDRIGRVIARSPSLWVRRAATVSMARASHARLPDRMWIDVGSREGHHAEVVPYMVRDARALRDVQMARGMRFGRDLGYLEQPGEAHGMEAGGRRMQTALAFALGGADLGARAPSAVSIYEYPTAPDARWQAFAVEARYESPLRLTWPAASIDVRTEGADHALAGDLVRARHTALVAEVAGVIGRCR